MIRRHKGLTAPRLQLQRPTDAHLHLSPESDSKKDKVREGNRMSQQRWRVRHKVCCSNIPSSFVHAADLVLMSACRQLAALCVL